MLTSRNTWQVLAIVAAICVSFVLYAFGEIFYALHYFAIRNCLDWLGGPYVSFIDPYPYAKSLQARSLGFATACVGVLAWVCFTNMPNVVYGLICVLPGIILVHWTTPTLPNGPRGEYLLALFAMQTAVIFCFVVPFIRQRTTIARRSYTFSVRQLLFLTLLVAVTIFFFPTVGNAVLHHSMNSSKTPNWWLLILGAVAGVNSLLWGLPAICKYGFKLVSCGVAILFTITAGVLVPTAYIHLHILWPPSHTYDSRAFNHLHNGYVHWLICHGMIQLAMVHAWSALYDGFKAGYFGKVFGSLHRSRQAKQGLRLEAAEKDV
jgi:hypothetical protein